MSRRSVLYTKRLMQYARTHPGKDLPQMEAELAVAKKAMTPRKRQLRRTWAIEAGFKT